MAQEIKIEVETVESCQCPLCGREITNWFCPDCGVPLSTNHCMRPEYKSFNEYQFCAKCGTRNPYGAKYCRNCREEIYLHAKDKNGHEWIDLGLSVLWSSEALPHRFRWNDTNIIYEDQDYSRELRELYIKSNYGEIGGKDAATHYWGEKWRTPTKEDFEELITKCKWEKYIIPTANQFALKGTGPNGNSIVFPMVEQKRTYLFGISLWSSSQKENERAYAFRFLEEVKFERTSTAKQKKWLEFYKSNQIRFKVDLSKEEIWSSQFRGIFSNLGSYTKIIEEKRRKVFPQYEKTLEQQQKILDAMGDDSHEREANEKADLKRWHHLWLTSPIKITISADPDITNGTIGLKSLKKLASCAIRPVADKKWQGKL